MNRKYNLKLDLQFRCNNSIMKFNQFDNNTSDFFMKISSGGKSFDVEKAIVVLATIKPSGKVASQFVEIENGLVYADLKPNMVDEIGIYTAQAMLILEDERVVTDVISYEVEEDKIFSLLNDTVGTSEEFTLLTDMLSRLSTIEISEEQRVINEAERILSEENRKIEEAKRVEVELIRQHEEADRAKYDATRESNENIRKINEEARISSENVRLENEANRIEQEANRVKAEQLRKDNYNLMTEDEERRRSEANAHKEAETLRVSAENTRVNEEAKRRTTEQARVSAENTRVSNENTRKANEVTRQTNETQRVEAETQRQNRYNSFIADAEANTSNFENYTNNAKVKEEERKSNELDRKSQETKRVSNEVERISNENTRKANEVTRIESEKQRADAENLRKEKIIEIQSDYDSLKKVIIDENASANLQNQINHFYSQLEHKANLSTTSNLQNQINDLVLESGGDGNLEVIQARNGFDTLVGNINNIYSEIEGYSRKYQYLLSDNFITGKYYMFYSPDVGVVPPTIQKGDNENCAIYPAIRLKAGEKYYFENLYNQFCYITDLIGNTKIGTLEGLLEYVPEQDCLLYITISTKNIGKAMFCNTVLPFKYTEGFIETEIDNLKINTLINPQNTSFIDVKTQYINDNNCVDGYYNRNQSTITTQNGTRALNKIKINEGTEYSFCNIYAYFTTIIYQDGTKELLTDDTTVNFSGSFVAKQDGYIYITIHSDNIGKAMFCNDNCVPDSFVIGDYKYAFKDIIKEFKNELIVKKDGTGDFTSIVDAVNEANKTGNVNIYVYTGEYDLLEELGGQNWLDSIKHEGEFSERQGLRLGYNVNLYGVGMVVCKFELPDTVTYTQSQCVSALNLYTSNIVENIEFVAKNCRYTLHDETNGGNPNLTRHIKNCRFTHLGNKEGLWEYPTVLGGGCGGGSQYDIINCQFITNHYNRAFSYHTNHNATPSHFNIDGCVGIVKDSNGISFRAGYYGSGHTGKTIFNFKNCSGNGKVVKSAETSDSIDHIEMYNNGYVLL